ncbi:hypothetical protein [Novosphingobium sp.]|uniref:hypothetical protein n=1 Tax=Novosphingobium sp. TaxID=1874826 RepID=UPI0027336C7E|nr:hypothetical protein [Novosphingobium sp.]MDP3907614.1 hypothetical protein [Novosphingobium sp.]
MDLDALIQHFFETGDPATLTEAEYELGLERLRIGFGVEREPGRKFALWTLLDALGVAPLPADAFAKEPALKAAAEDYLSAAFRLERFGPRDDDA